MTRERLPKQPIRILLADDHEIVREGLRMLLSEEPEIDVVGEASSGAEAIRLCAALSPDVVLMDVVMPGMNGIEATRGIRENKCRAHVLMLTSFSEDGIVRDAIRAGAVGYVMKDVSRADLLRAIKSAAQGVATLHPAAQRSLMNQIVDPPAPSLLDSLTDRETDVLTQIARGRSNKEIAAALSLTEGTVKGYVSTILVKLEVDDRTQAALYAVKNGIE